MAAPSPWPMIHAERAALADDLSSLTGTQWATRSLCTEWTVQEVLGHMSATAKMTPARFFRKLAGSGFHFDAMSAKLVAGESAGSPADTLAEFREHLNDSTSPPGPVETMLGEVVIHSADIRRPLAIAHQYPPAALVRVAELLQGFEPAHRREAAHRRPDPARDRRRLVDRIGCRSDRPDPVADPRHDRALGRIDRPERRGCCNAERAGLTRLRCG